MLEDFLAFARPRPLDRAPVDLFQVVEDVVDYCAPAASTSSVELALHGARVVADVDRDKVRQVLLNLVLNAIQASPPESTVKIAVQAADARAVLTVEDTGPGLPAPAHAVFEPFFTTKPGGTGLGLSIVRRIVEDHGGHIEVESQPARTVFSVRLPIATIRHDAPA
jgi:signal transduction histidine kinase